MKTNVLVEAFPSFLKGKIVTPPSKSLSHRALICAALSDGESKISNIIYSEDIVATISSLEAIGAKFTKHKDELHVKGVKKLKLKSDKVDCNESGSTLRFLIPLFSLTNKEVTFTGKASLINRPLDIYKEIFEQNGDTFEINNNELVVKGSIKSNTYHIKGDVSSQFFTGLMFALPLLEEDSYIYIDGTLESKSYIDLTIDILSHFGIEIVELENGYFIEGSQTYKPKDYRVEGDYSQAAFFLVGGIISGFVTIDDLKLDSFQGDKQIINIIKDMKGRVIFAENGFVVNESQTTSTKIDLSDCPDLGPIVALLAAVSKGTTKIINAGRLRIKESDRIESTVNTLKAIGANIKATEDEIIIVGRKTLAGGVTVDSYNDHRIAMMLTIASLRCEKPITIQRADAINKSYPHFYEDFNRLGGKVIKKGWL